MVTPPIARLSRALLAAATLLAVVLGSVIIPSQSARADDVASATITGTISTKIVGKYYPAIRVTLYRFDGESWPVQKQVQVWPTGKFSLGWVTPGSYKVHFEGPGTSAKYGFDSFSDGATDFESAKAILVKPNQKLVLTMAQSRQDAGVITGQYLTPNGLSGYTTGTAFPVIGDPTSANRIIDWTNPTEGHSPDAIGPKGTFTIKGLAAGNYIVLVDANNNSPIEMLYFGRTVFDENDEPYFSDWTTDYRQAQVFTVAADATTTLPVLIAPRYAPIGLDFTVRDAVTNLPISGAQVTATMTYPVTTPPRYATSDGAGMGRFGAAAATYDYTVVVRDGTGANLYQPATGTYVNTSTAPALALNLSPTVSPPSFDSLTIDGGDEFAVGSEYTAITEVDATAAAPVSFQWLRDGAPIFGAVSANYVALSADLGHQLSVRATIRQFGFADVVGTAAVSGVTSPGPAPTITSEPTIALSGNVATARPGQWSVAATAFSYQWLRDGAVIPGATKSSFPTTIADAGKLLSVSVVATKSGHAASTAAVSDSVLVALRAAPALKKKPVVTAKSLAGGVVRYSVTSGTWATVPSTFSYGWELDGVALEASGAFLELPAATPGVLRVEVRGTKAGFEDAVTTVVARKNNRAPLVTSPASVTTGGEVVGDGSELPVGATVRATRGAVDLADSVTDAATSYLWQRSADGLSWTPISKATARDYLLTVTDAGKRLRAVVTTTSSSHSPLVELATGGTVVLRGDLSVDPPALEVRGSGAVGTAQTAVLIGSWNSPGVRQSYQWFACLDSDCSTSRLIPKATAASYSPKAADVGLPLTVTVTAAKAGYQAHSTSATTPVIVVATSITTLARPVVTGLTGGAVALGAEVRATPSVVDLSGVARTGVWEGCYSACESEPSWHRINGTARTSFTATVDTYSFYTRVRYTETVSKNGVAPLTVSSLGHPIAIGTLSATKAPTVKTTATQFVASTGDWRPVGVADVSYSWSVNGSYVSDGAWIERSSVPAGAVVTVTVTATAQAFEANSRELVAQKGAAPTVSTGAIVGDQYGTPLVAPTGLFVYPTGQDPHAVYGHQWLSNGVAIKGATLNTFAPSANLVGKKLSVRVTAKSAYYADKVATTAAVLVRSAAAPSAADPTINVEGTVIPGTRLVAAAGSYDSAGVAMSYQWQRASGSGWADIAKATKPEYVVAASDTDLQLRVRVTGVRAGAVASILYSSPVTVSPIDNLVALEVPTVVGAAVAGKTLTAQPGIWSVPSVAVRFQWMRNGVVIPGATALTFQTSPSHLGDEISVVVTATRAGYSTGVASSLAVTVGN